MSHLVTGYDYPKPTVPFELPTKPTPAVTKKQEIITKPPPPRTTTQRIIVTTQPPTYLPPEPLCKNGAPDAAFPDCCTNGGRGCL